MECATLGLLYLKELLKNNAQQLNKFTLSFRYYDPKSEKLCHFFLPSPQVLRYSHSGFYNAVIEAMLQTSIWDTLWTDGIKEINHDRKKLLVPSIKKLLTASIQIARSRKEHEIVAENEDLLKALPAFQAQWLQESAEVNRKRELMHYAFQNRYLAYSTKRMERLKNDKVSADNTAVSVNQSSKLKLS